MSDSVQDARRGGLRPVGAIAIAAMPAVLWTALMWGHSDDHQVAGAPESSATVSPTTPPSATEEVLASRASAPSTPTTPATAPVATAIAGSNQPVESAPPTTASAISASSSIPPTDTQAPPSSRGSTILVRRPSGQPA